MLSLWQLALLALATLVGAERDLYKDEYCFSACMAPTYYLTFPDTFKFCVSPFERDSLLLCAQNYCTAAEFDAGLAITNDTCVEDYGGPWPGRDEIDAILNSYTSQQYDSFQVIDWPLPVDTIKGHFRLSQHLFDDAFTTVQQGNDIRYTHLYYSYAQFIFWGIVIGLGTTANLLSYLRSLSWSYSASASNTRVPITHAGLPRRLWTQVRARLLLPALFKKRAAEPVMWGQGTLAPRAESLIIIAMIILNVVLCAVTYPTTSENIYYASTALQVWRYFSDRTGYLAYANLAIFWLFAVRNNVLLWMTGWQFATFNRFHRWVARVATLQAVLHSVGYTAYEFIEGKAFYDASWLEEYWYTGAIATVAMALMIGLSVRTLRAHFYEVFLLLHIALSLIVLVNLFYHTKIFEGQYDGFLWPAVAFWVFDRVLRIGRIIYSTVRSQKLRSLVEYAPADEIVRVDATAVFSGRNAVGGVHHFIYTPYSLRFWESHPFTLVRWKSALASSPPASPVIDDAEKKEAALDVASDIGSEDAEHYSFLLRPRRGFTGRLAGAAKTGPRMVPLLFEGGYGHAPDLRRFRDVLLVIGGSGISVGISVIYAALDQSSTVGLHLIWASRTAGLIDGVMGRELRAAAGTAQLAVEAFVTGTKVPMQAGNYEDVQTGRPDVAAKIRQAVAERRGPLAVVVCGPAGMMDDARAAFVEELKGGAMDVQLFLESFEW